MVSPRVSIPAVEVFNSLRHLTATAIQHYHLNLVLLAISDPYVPQFGVGHVEARRKVDVSLQLFCFTDHSILFPVCMFLNEGFRGLTAISGYHLESYAAFVRHRIGQLADPALYGDCIHEHLNV